MPQHELYRIERLPVLQNRVYSTSHAARNCATGDAVLVQDLETGFIFNRAFQPDLVVYDSNYNNEQSFSDAFQQHLADVCYLIESTCPNGTFLEVGCGKGFFLDKMRRRGNSITGLDPAYEGQDPNIRKEFFTPQTDLCADAIILRHVLEHIPDPVTFLDSIRRANRGKGLIYIEVPCLDWILQRNAWFDIFYEHVNYFRLSDFHRMFSSVHHAEHSFGGQYLSIVAELQSLRIPKYEAPPVEFPLQFTSGLRRSAEQIRQLRTGAKTVAIWGAASKGVIFSLGLARTGTSLDFAIDINPAKHGKFLPCTGLPVLSPEAAFSNWPGETFVFVMNPNYLGEIQGMCPSSYQCIAA